MDAAFPNPIDGRRLLGHLNERSAEMPQGLSESEFEKEVDACLPQLTSVSRRLCSDDDIAGDAVQQALLRASRAWRSFRGGSQVSTWLTRIVIRESRRAMTDSRRKRMRTNSISNCELGNEESDSQLATAPSQGPRRQVQQDELKQLVRQAASELPDRQREVFALIVWQEMPVSEVAELLEIKEQNVYANLHAAREQLKHKLSEHLDAEDHH
jgi:RNA polymerase sigma-70 factor (ECF subfamily)